MSAKYIITPPSQSPSVIQTSVWGGEEKDPNTDETKKEPKILVKWSYDNENMLAEWCDIAQCYKWLNAQSHAYYANLHAWFTIPAITFSTISGTASFAQASLPVSFVMYAPMIIGTVNIIIGILTTVQQYLKVSELKEAHRLSAVAWDRYARNIRIELTKYPLERKEAGLFVKLCRHDFDKLMETNPIIPKHIIREFKRTFAQDRTNVGGGGGGGDIGSGTGYADGGSGGDSGEQSRSGGIRGGSRIRRGNIRHGGLFRPDICDTIVSVNDTRYLWFTQREEFNQRDYYRDHKNYRTPYGDAESPRPMRTGSFSTGEGGEYMVGGEEPSYDEPRRSTRIRMSVDNLRKHNRDQDTDRQPSNWFGRMSKYGSNVLQYLGGRSRTNSVESYSVTSSIGYRKDQYKNCMTEPMWAHPHPPPPVLRRESVSFDKPPHEPMWAHPHPPPPVLHRESVSFDEPPREPVSLTISITPMSANPCAASVDIPIRQPSISRVFAVADFDPQPPIQYTIQEPAVDATPDGQSLVGVGVGRDITESGEPKVRKSSVDSSDPTFRSGTEENAPPAT